MSWETLVSAHARMLASQDGCLEFRAQFVSTTYPATTNYPSIKIERRFRFAGRVLCLSVKRPPLPFTGYLTVDLTPAKCPSSVRDHFLKRLLDGTRRTPRHRYHPSTTRCYGQLTVRIRDNQNLKCTRTLEQ